MNHPKITAIGSSPLIAKEISTMLASILQPLPEAVQSLTTLTTANVPQKPAADTFYVCANTQGSILAEKIPQEQFFILELQPTTRFFLDIAKIPVGEDVYVFNNLLPYIRLLIQECRELGIQNLHFHPLAFDEMPADEIEQGLKKAKWLVGVASFVGQEVLLSNRYKKYLRPELTVIAGRRIASVASASHLIAAIAHFYKQRLQEDWHKRISTADDALLAAKICRITHQLQETSLEIIKQQISGPAENTVFSSSRSVKEKTSVILPNQPDITDIPKSFQKLDYLIQRIEQLASVS